MRKSKTETAETRKRIIATAAELFLERGLAATGIADVMAAAGLTQGGFYRHFESKEQLIAEASEAAFDLGFERLGKAVAGMPAREALSKAVNMYLFQRQRPGSKLCPLAHLASELPHTDANVKAVVDIGHRRTVDFIARLLHQLDLDNPAQAAEAIVSTMLGAVMLARLALTEEAGTAILNNAEKTVDLIIQAAKTGSAMSTTA
jgi:TetR/AcrR family transcriptional regulator, transcriptional repressor for nem operon